MAIINGQVPPMEKLPADYRRRVVVKFRPDVRLTYSAAAHSEIATAARREWAELTAAHPGITLALEVTNWSRAVDLLRHRVMDLAVLGPTEELEDMAVKKTAVWALP